MFDNLRYFFVLKLIKYLTPYFYLRIKRFCNIGSLHISNWKNKDIMEFMRPSIKFIKKYFEIRNIKNLIGVEVGVYKGNNALSILKELNIKKLYLIDMWQFYHNLNKDFDFSIYYNLVKELFGKNKRVKIIKDFSINACKLFKDNSLDFVYIDANHDYNYVYDDIKNWYKKIKSNGILCGHDILMKDVFNALMDYCIENRIRFFIEPPDWYIIKRNEKMILSGQFKNFKR